MTEGESENPKFSPPVTFGDSPITEGAIDVSLPLTRINGGK